MRDPLTRLIEDSIDKIKCYRYNSIKGHHDWINVYNPKRYPIGMGQDLKITVQAPYQMCQYCHKRSNDKE